MVSRRWGALALASTLLATSAGDARGDEPAPATPESVSPPRPPTRGRRVIATAAAILPGVIVRGSGHWLVDDRRTARRLLVIEGIGLGLAALGGIPLGISGGAEETLPGLALLVPATGLLVTTLAADIWGTAGGAGIAGTLAPPPALDVAAGYTFVGDPRVPFANLATVDATAWLGPAQLRASGWAGDAAWQARATAGVRVYGPRPRAAHAGDTSALDLTVSAAEERRAEQGLRIATGEAGVLARVDLARIGPTLHGTFATIGMGFGAERIRYTDSGAADTSGLMSARIGWGFVLGDMRGSARALETEIYYEHRRDTLAGGLTLHIPFNGFIGYLGVVTTAWQGRYGVSARIDAGSAYVATLAAHVRLPELP
jgi:hypothetical protein